MYFARIALAAVISLLCQKLFDRYTVLKKMCISPVVVGGLAYSVVYSILTATGVATIVTDQSLYSTLFIIFFTSVGFMTVINTRLIKAAGKMLVILFIAEGFWLVAQTFMALFLGGKVLGMPYPIADLTGSLTMFGGIPSGAAWGAKAEEFGFAGAVGIGIACGAMGQLMGGLLSAPVARKCFIDKFNLRSTDEPAVEAEAAVNQIIERKGFSFNRTMKQVLLFGIAIPVGAILRTWFMDLTGFFILDFVGSMVVAIILTNVGQKVKVIDVDQEFMSNFSNIVLNIFVTMSFFTLNLAELKDLIGPAMIVVAVQLITIILYVNLLFRLMGKSYDAAMLLAGFMGHALGDTTCSLASLDTLQAKYGSSKTAYVITPLIGACLIDIWAVPIEATGFNIALKLAGVA